MPVLTEGGGKHSHTIREKDMQASVVHFDIGHLDALGLRNGRAVVDEEKPSLLPPDEYVGAGHSRVNGHAIDHGEDVFNATHTGRLFHDLDSNIGCIESHVPRVGKDGAPGLRICGHP